MKRLGCLVSLFGSTLATLLAGNFAQTGSPQSIRADTLFSLTLLHNGKVLALGGAGVTSRPTAELYDPAVGEWKITTAPPSLGRAVMLSDGRALIVTGLGEDGRTQTALFDPLKEIWEPGAEFGANFDVDTFTVLSNGKVLSTGFDTDSRSVSRSELYDPATTTWKPTGDPSIPMFVGYLLALQNGDALRLGGQVSRNDGFGSISYSPDIDVYSAIKGEWHLNAYRPSGIGGFQGVELANGKLLIIGGVGDDHTISRQVDLFDPANGSWVETSPLGTNRVAASATLLSNGTVMVAGGSPGVSVILRSTELYDPSSGIWREGAPMLRARYGQHAIRLTNGNVLVVGGYNPWANSSPLAIATAELYVPDTQVTLNAVKNPNGGISLSFTNFPGAKFVVVSSPDVTTPLANWELTGPALEADAGLFEFSVPQPVDKARFYRARAE